MAELATDEVDPTEAARLIGVSRRTLDEWRRKRGYGPPHRKVGRSRRYRISEITAWLEAQRIDPGEANARAS